MKNKTKIGLIVIAAIVAVILISGCVKNKCGDEIKPDSPLECQIRDITMLFPMAGGFTFSPVDENIVVYAIPDNNKIYQIHRRNLDTSEDVCLTCNNQNGPSIGLHKGAPTFHPDGKHIIMQVEMEEHPFEGELGDPGAGWFNNLWMTTINGDQWWQLTNYPHGDKDSYGVLFPRVSHDGKKIAWSQLYKSDPKGQYDYRQGKMVPNSNPWGLWQLNIADLVIDENPHIENIKSYRPGNGNFYEPQEWSLGDDKLMFASDIQKDHVYKLDIWMIDVNTQELTQLTNTNGAWEEFASFSPNGKKISFMSSECCNWDPENPKSIPFKSTLATELYIMDSDGANKVQLTSFNENGLPGSEWDKYLQGRIIITENKWSSDGKKIFFGMVFFSENNEPLGAAVWELTFEGACGNLK